MGKDDKAEIPINAIKQEGFAQSGTEEKLG